MAKIQDTDNTERQQGSEATENFIIAGGNEHWYPIWKCLAISYKTKHSLTIQLHSRSPSYLHEGVRHVRVSQVLVEALCILVKTCNQPRYPLVKEQRAKPGDFQTMHC